MLSATSIVLLCSSPVPVCCSPPIVSSMSIIPESFADSATARRPLSPITEIPFISSPTLANVSTCFSTDFALTKSPPVTITPASTTIPSMATTMSRVLISVRKRLKRTMTPSSSSYSSSSSSSYSSSSYHSPSSSYSSSSYRSSSSSYSSSSYRSSSSSYSSSSYRSSSSPYSSSSYRSYSSSSYRSSS